VGSTAFLHLAYAQRKLCFIIRQGFEHVEIGGKLNLDNIEVRNKKQVGREELSRVLLSVNRPARYTGGEYNSIVKDWDKASVKMALAFPDVYEVGMSHLGGRILYGLVNSQPDYLLERVFAPWPDMEEVMRREGWVLYSLESFRPVREFDVVGFSLQYELSFTNVLNMLELAGIPLWSGGRREGDPLVIAGGPVCFNPEPVTPFFDAFLIGDGEDVLLEFLTVLNQNRDRPRKEVLSILATIEGVYVPGLYKVSYNDDGTLRETRPLQEGIPSRVKKRVVQDLDQAYYPLNPVVPFLDIVHDRAVLEVMRGCQRACRFCQAGMTYRPVREKSFSTLANQAQAVLENTGYEEISLASLSTADYSNVERLVEALIKRHGARGIGVSLPSLRADAFSVKLASEVQKVRKTTLTFAPEAGTERLRRVINKNVSEEDLMAAVEAAFTAGWNGVKLYFMIGLPTETYEDLDGILDLLSRVRGAGRAKGVKRLNITASISNFVPKPHTPFQWEPQLKPAELEARRRYLLNKVKGLKGVHLDFHDPETSYLEGIMARGDRRLASAIYRAYRLGCKFDGWKEFFRADLWSQAFAEENIDPDFYTARRREYTEVFPWDIIDSGVDKEYLISEHERSRLGISTPDCRYDKCVGCGVCPTLGVELDLRGEEGFARKS